MIYVNEAGRDLLVDELRGLSRKNDHFHGGDYPGAEVELRTISYVASEQIVRAVKVLFRPDDWDREYFPHVMAEPAED